MSQQQSIQPYSELLIAGLGQQLAPYDQSMEGGLNVFTESIPGSSTLQVYKQQNPFRKSLTLLNIGSVDLSLVILNQQNVEQLIPLPKGGGFNFQQIIRGHIEQCINGVSLVQYITTCEYEGIIKIKNATITTGTLLVIEAI